MITNADRDDALEGVEEGKTVSQDHARSSGSVTSGQTWPRLYRIGRKRYFVVGHDFIQRVRPYDDERISGFPADELAWATSLSRAKALFHWHRDNGLHRGEPHPMGKDLATLRRAYNAHHAERYRQAGMEVPGCYLESGTQDGSSPNPSPQLSTGEQP